MPIHDALLILCLYLAGLPLVAVPLACTTDVPASVRVDLVDLDNGETWTARLARQAPDAALDEGDRVVVTRVDGASVEVAPEGSAEAPGSPGV